MAKHGRWIEYIEIIRIRGTRRDPQPDAQHHSDRKATYFFHTFLQSIDVNDNATEGNSHFAPLSVRQMADKPKAA